MSLDIFQTLEIIEVLENFLDKFRPPEEMRHDLDIIYKIDGQSIIIYEIRPRWDKPEEILECEAAKATFVHTKKHWKIFWMRSDLKWHSYKPKPAVKTIKDFIKVISEDKYGCFWG